MIVKFYAPNLDRFCRRDTEFTTSEVWETYDYNGNTCVPTMCDNPQIESVELTRIDDGYYIDGHEISGF